VRPLHSARAAPVLEGSKIVRCYVHVGLTVAMTAEPPPRSVCHWQSVAAIPNCIAGADSIRRNREILQAVRKLDATLRGCRPRDWGRT
jgi:hypothetical protein